MGLFWICVLLCVNIVYSRPGTHTNNIHEPNKYPTTSKSSWNTNNANHYITKIALGAIAKKLNVEIEQIWPSYHEEELPRKLNFHPVENVKSKHIEENNEQISPDNSDSTEDYEDVTIDESDLSDRIDDVVLCSLLGRCIEESEYKT